MMNDHPNSILLGRTDIHISPMGIGAWAWGDQHFWGYGYGYTDEDIQAAVQVTLSAGINFFDTAEIYGRGKSERLAGKFLNSYGESQNPGKNRTTPLVIATKFFPYPWRLTKKRLVNALRGSLERLGIDQVSLYQVHWPYPPVPVEKWADGLADAFEQGLTQAVGVSNYNKVQMRRTVEVLNQRSLSLASNQVEYHLLNRRVEKNGLLALCQEMGITLIAYSPLAQGILTGKYSAENPPPRARRQVWTREKLERVKPLLSTMRSIGASHGGKTPAQVALNWVICKGGVPIPGAKNAQQAEENAGGLGWQLSAEELLELDQMSDQFHE